VRRAYYLGAMAHLFGYTPAEVDDLDVADFDHLAEWAEDYLARQEQTGQ
jgi:hypothetical protein